MITTRDTLLLRLKAGEAHEAWKEFYDLYWGAILRYARKLGLDAVQAEDVLQETMVALMRILPEFAYDPSKGKFRNFLLTIVHRKCLRVIWRARRERESLVPWEGQGEAESAAPAWVDDAAEAEALSRWREALFAEVLQELRADPSLGARTFAVFEAYVLNRRPAGAVAAEFGLKENAVYQIKNRLLRRVERRIAELMQTGGAE